MDAMNPPPAPPPLDYAAPAPNRIGWRDLWTYRAPVLIEHPTVAWRIALLLIVLWVLQPLAREMGLKDYMLYMMMLTAAAMAFGVRLVLDVLVLAHRFAERIRPDR